MRVLVAGGAGFLGSHLCAHFLAAGHSVVALDSFLTGTRDNLAGLDTTGRLAVVEHDVRAPLPDGLDADLVFNLACPASPPRYRADPVHTLLTAVVGTHHLLDLAARCGAVFVQASTSEVYGDPEEHPQTEGYWGRVNPIGPRACYDEGKRAGETLCFDYLRLGRADVRVARIFNAYGPRMQPDDGRIVSNFVGQALAGRPLTVYGTGAQTRSFCYVSDMVRGLAALGTAAANPGRPVNLGNPAETGVLALAHLVMELTGARAGIAFEPLPHDDPRRRRPDIAAAHSLLGWSPEVGLRDGLTATIAWFAGRAGMPAGAGDGAEASRPA